MRNVEGCIHGYERLTTAAVVQSQHGVSRAAAKQANLPTKAQSRPSLCVLCLKE